jgi:hypothetical protein
MFLSPKGEMSVLTLNTLVDVDLDWLRTASVKILPLMNCAPS